MRLGIFGGTFNPPHAAHLIIAEIARQEAGLDRIFFTPSARPPHKTDEPVIAFEHRWNMVKEMIAGHPAFEASDVENRLDGPSYTLHTLRYWREQDPKAEWFLIIGADSLLDLPNWKEPDALIGLARLIVYPRVGCDPKKAEPRFLERSVIIERPLVDIASRWIRERVARGETVRYLVPDSVLAYIQKHRLYS